MITILHGENIAASRKLYIDLRQQSATPTVLEGSLVDIAQLTQALQGTGLFEETKQIFIEDLFSKKKSGRDLDNLAAYIKDQGSQNAILLWESKEITPKQIKSLGQPQVKKFDFPKEIFNFLDNIKPGNAKFAIASFHKTLQTEEAEFVFFMIVRHMRILLALGNEESETTIDEVKRLAPWQTGKLQKQALLFTKDNLLIFYRKLFMIEQGIKTGQLAQNLTSSIDFLLASL